jgi:hypothetical protein
MSLSNTNGMTIFHPSTMTINAMKNPLKPLMVDHMNVEVMSSNKHPAWIQPIHKDADVLSEN